MREKKNDDIFRIDDESESWREKLAKDVSRVEAFLEKEIEKGTQTERNIEAYLREREKKKFEKDDNWMDELDHVSFIFLIMEIVLVAYLILALIGIVPMF